MRALLLSVALLCASIVSAAPLLVVQTDAKRAAQLPYTHAMLSDGSLLFPSTAPFEFNTIGNAAGTIETVPPLDFFMLITTYPKRKYTLGSPIGPGGTGFCERVHVTGFDRFRERVLLDVAGVLREVRVGQPTFVCHNHFMQVLCFPVSATRGALKQPPFPTLTVNGGAVTVEEVTHVCAPYTQPI